MPTRFASLAPLPARLLLAMIAALIALGVAGSFAPLPAPRLGPADQSDSALYRTIAARSDSLGDYYVAATQEQRTRGYPLRPFVTVREPALALASHRLGERGTALAFRLLALAAAALAWRLRGVAGRVERIAALVLAVGSTLLLAQPVMALWHEAWAGMLLTLALCARTTRRWWPAIPLALAAVLVRELAAPMLAAMALAALTDRRGREATAWLVALGLFVAAMALHATMVSENLLPGDPVSPGWARLGGWRFILTIAHGTSLLMLLPMPLVAVAVPLALLGWAARGQAFTDRVTLVLAATIVPFMAVGRPDNLYWGLLFAPLLPIGLAFAPRALVDLARQAVSGAPCTPAWTADASS